MSAIDLQPESAAQPVALNYRVDGMRPSSRLWGFGLLFGAALGFVVLGGCFLIGVMLMLDPQMMFGTPAPPLTAGPVLFIGVCYLLALSCFVAAAWLLTLAVKGVLRVFGSISS